MSRGLVTGLTLSSYSHDAKWTLFQGRPILAVLTTAFFTFRITDLAELLVKIPRIKGLESMYHSGTEKSSEKILVDF